MGTWYAVAALDVTAAWLQADGTGALLASAPEAVRGSTPAGGACRTWHMRQSRANAFVYKLAESEGLLLDPPAFHPGGTKDPVKALGRPAPAYQPSSSSRSSAKRFGSVMVR